MAQWHAQRRALKQRTYLSARAFGSAVTVHTGQFASLEREIRVSSHTVAVALLRTLRTRVERLYRKSARY
jgi:hypothetical protein